MESWAQPPQGPAGKVLTDGSQAARPAVGSGGSAQGPRCGITATPPLPVTAATPPRGPAGSRPGGGGPADAPSPQPLGLRDEWSGRRGPAMGRAQGPWPPTAPCLLPAPMGRVSPALGSLGGQVGLAGPCARHTDGLSQNGHSRCALQTLPPQLGSGLQPSLPAAGLIRAFTPPTGHQRQRPRFYPLVAQPAAPRCPQLPPREP